MSISSPPPPSRTPTPASSQRGYVVPPIPITSPSVTAIKRVSPALNSRKRGSPCCPPDTKAAPDDISPPAAKKAATGAASAVSPKSASTMSTATTTAITSQAQIQTQGQAQSQTQTQTQAQTQPAPTGSMSVSRRSTPSQSPRTTNPSIPPSPSTVAKRQRKTSDTGVKVLPKLYQSTHTKDLVILISDMLGELVGLNDQIPLSGAGLTRFHSRAPPSISITDYLHRLSVHASLQPSILLSMVYYIDILSTHYPPFVVSSLTVHRFLITAATVATKGLCDTFLTNSLYAKIGGLSLMELNMLELEFLVRVGWRIVPKAEVLEEYYRSLVMRMGGRYTVEPTPPVGEGEGREGGEGG